MAVDEPDDCTMMHTVMLMLWMMIHTVIILVMHVVVIRMPMMIHADACGDENSVSVIGNSLYHVE
jgi:hypothetical protein